jgi:hypothetical protein
MKQISAILIAFFLCVSTTQVSAQQIPNLKTVNTNNYAFTPDDTAVLFIDLPGANTNCTLPAPSQDNKFRLLRIINRRGNALVINGKFDGLSTFTPSVKIGFRTTTELMNDGDFWFVVTKSY